MSIRRVGLVGTALVLIACAVREEDAGSTRGAITASSSLPIEPLYPAVGKFFPIQSEVGGTFCSAVVVGPNLVMTNAHCVETIANTCKGFARNDGGNAANPGTHVRFDTNGDFSAGSFTWDVDGIATPPKAFYRDARTCPPSSAGDCTNQHNPPVEFFTGGRAEQDFALIHVRTSSSIPDLVARGMTPLRVVTALFDPQASTFSHPYAVHLNLSRSQFQGGSSVPWVRMVGCGTATPNDGNRHSALAAVQQTPTWPSLISWNGARLCDGTADPALTSYMGTLLNTLASQGNATYASGDSGGALLISGGQTNTPAGTPPKGDFLIGLLSDQVPPVGQMSPTIFDSSPEARAWLEQRLLDFDGDGVQDSDGSDNCPLAWNASQANCNYVSENAWNLRNSGSATKAAYLGDACEPVPCPTFDVAAITSEYGSGPGGGASCIGDGFNTPILCNARRVHDVADIHAVGANWIGAYASLPKQNFDHVVTVANTSPRFCQAKASQSYECLNPIVVQDNRLQLGVPPVMEVNTVAQPYHRVTLAKGTCSIPTSIGCALYSYGADLPRGETLQNFQYGVPEYRNYRWSYAVDSAFWISNGLIPPNDTTGYETTCTSALFGSGTCLDGTFWLNSDNLVGLSGGNQLPDAFVDRRTPNFITNSDAYFANHYENVRPDSTDTWRLIGAAPSTLRKLLLRHLILPDPNPWGAWQAQHLAQSLPVLNSFGAPFELTNSGTLNDASTMVGPVLAAVLDGRAWVNAAEPESGRALALSSDGTQMLYGADPLGKKLMTTLDVILTSRKTYSPLATTDDNRSFSAPVMLTIPAVVRVAEGNAGNATVTFSYTEAGVARTCTYKGGASSLHPTAAAQIRLGTAYNFLSCTSGATSGAAITVSSVGLHIVDGDNASGATSAQMKFLLSEPGSAGANFGAAAYNGATRPSTRSAFLATYSASADRVFLVGGVSALGAPLTDVWWRPTIGEWQTVPVTLSAPQAATYSRTRLRLVVLDRTPSALELVSIDVDAGTRQTLASWALPVDTTRFALMNSLEGSILVVGGTGRTYRVVSVDDRGQALATTATTGTLVDAFADRAGYSFLVEGTPQVQRAKALDLQTFGGAPFP